MKKASKIILTTIFLFIALIIFYQINSLNYNKHLEIKQNLVEHPENLPTKEAALNTSFGFKNLRADIYWLEAIQYIGGNAIGSEYKKYLFAMIDLITELNPYFEHPYSIGQLLLPSYNERYEDLDNKQQEKHINEAEALGLKGIKNFCDQEKIKLIEQEDNLQKIWTEDKYKNPCSEYKIPYYLAYVYYQYKNDPTTAALYYKVTSAIEDGLEGSKVMAAIMSGKGGNREKSYFMFLNIAKYIEKEDEVCLNFASDLEMVGAEIFINKRVKLDGNILKNIENSRKQIFGSFNEENEEEVLSDTKCSNYVNKATRELNLAYLEEANKKFKSDKNENSINAMELFEAGYIDYLPIDFQQYEDYGIIYEFNDDTGNYDYSIGNYN